MLHVILLRFFWSILRICLPTSLGSPLLPTIRIWVVRRTQELPCWPLLLRHDVSIAGSRIWVLSIEGLGTPSEACVPELHVSCESHRYSLWSATVESFFSFWRVALCGTCTTPYDKQIRDFVVKLHLRLLLVSICSVYSAPRGYSIALFSCSRWSQVGAALGADLVFPNRKSTLTQREELGRRRFGSNRTLVRPKGFHHLRVRANVYHGFGCGAVRETCSNLLRYQLLPLNGSPSHSQLWLSFPRRYDTNSWAKFETFDF